MNPETPSPSDSTNELPPLPPIIDAAPLPSADMPVSDKPKPMLSIMSPAGANKPDTDPQFDDAELEYEPSGKLLFAWLVILVIAIGSMAAFLLLTPQGKELLGIGTPSSSSTTSSISSTTSSASSELQERNFSSASGEETTDQTVEDIDSGLTNLDTEADFEDFDAGLEFGAE